MDVIDSFLKKFEHERPEWELLRTHAVKICTAGLESIGVQGIITSRVKTDASLRKKLRARHTTMRQYQNEKSIMDDQMDFVGLRIALYFPNQKREVIDMLKDKFQYDAVRPFDRNWKPDEPGLYEHLFGQYVADHIWVHLRPEDQRAATGTVGKYASYQLEIQLRSVLMDAWAGISQDLEYKALSGALTITEHKLLDAIKGHVEVGELMLEQLHRVHRRRIETENERIRTTRELLETLVDSIPESQMTGLDLSGLDPLLVALQGIKADTPGCLRAILERLEVKTQLRRNLDQWQRDFHPVPGTLPFYLIEKMFPNMGTEKEKFVEAVYRIREGRPRKRWDSRYWQPLLWLSQELLKTFSLPETEISLNTLHNLHAVRRYAHIWCAEFYLNTQTASLPDDTCIINYLSQSRERLAPGVEFVAELCLMGLAPTEPRYMAPRQAGSSSTANKDAATNQSADNEPEEEDDRFQVVASVMQRGYTTQPQAWTDAVHDFCQSLPTAQEEHKQKFLRSAEITLWLMKVGEEHVLAEFLGNWPYKGRPFNVPERDRCWAKLGRVAQKYEDEQMLNLLGSGNMKDLTDPGKCTGSI
ncbi:hypothetical protein QBC37DRAFT_386513 [Rhypophila decipiens]|uniref:RelA/SpoT domain-containing protein n=1 Tax=Rhypophila decipiens TaxID=261697 RepID=A0AAN7B8U7_9PEZI|nr:hypothetical protein QBC37DRAFT_386513 [Rhypophila decipiens]